MKTLFDSEINSLLSRHAAFWHRYDVTRPLLAPCSLACNSRLGLLFDPALPAEGIYTPDMIRPQEIAKRLVRWLESNGIGDGDVFRLAGLESTVPWAEAVLGCPIFYSFVHDTMWAEKPANAPWPPDMPNLDRNPWLRKMLDLTSAIDQASAGRFPVSTLQLRGASDLLGAYLGASELCLLAYDDPQGLHLAIRLCTDLLTEMTRRQREALRPVQGGYFNHFQVWAPGTTAIWSQDLSTLFSPEMYREFFLEGDFQMAKSVNFPVLHTHTSESHCFSLWSEIDGLTLEVTIDPTGKSLDDILPELVRLQARMPLMVQAQNDDELERALAQLEPRGLLLVSRYQPGRLSVSEDLVIRRLLPSDRPQTGLVNLGVTSP